MRHGFVVVIGCWLTLVVASGWSIAADGPRPGDLFRTYTWTNEGGSAGGALRVGGRVGYGGGPIALPAALDLDDATRAELVIEKVLCHDGTRGLAVSVNGHDWLDVPEAPALGPEPWAYQHHIQAIVPVPLEQLRAGPANEVRLRVADEHPWNWPQNLIYGIHVRVYYDPSALSQPAGRLVSPGAGAGIGVQATIEFEAASDSSPIERVIVVGDFSDVNWEGDGRYRQWHSHYRLGVLSGYVGEATSAPWTIAWDTSWVPDQDEPWRLAAWVVDETGLTSFTPAVEGLRFEREGLQVELCRPSGVPTRWVTRVGEKSETFRVEGDLAHAVAARLAWVSWSPGYSAGIAINGQKVFEREGPRYAPFWHTAPLDDRAVLRPGENTLSTLMTPRYDGETVHGMEVNWPGIMVLIQYRP